jgi:hypothetical protein
MKDIDTLLDKRELLIKQYSEAYPQLTDSDKELMRRMFASGYSEGWRDAIANEVLKQNEGAQ